MIALSMIPQKFMIYAGAVILLAGGGAWWGYVKGSAKSQEVISNYKAQVIDLNSKLEQKKTVVIDHVITQYKTKIVHIKDVGDNNANVANTIVPDTCVLSNGWVYTHDSAAAGIEADRTRAANGTTSGIKATEALATVSDNYATYNALKAQTEALQAIITQTNAAIDEANVKVKKKHWWNK